MLDVACPHPHCRRYFASTETMGRHYERAHFTRAQLAEKYALPALAELLAAIGEALPDLEHYTRTHGPGPDERLARVRRAIAAGVVAAHRTEA